MPIAKWIEMTPAQRHYLDCRATLTRGTYVVLAPCKHLLQCEDGTRCGVEDNKPEICRVFNGKAIRGKYKFFIPENCTMAKP